MVMPTDQQAVDESIEVIEPVDTGEETEQAPLPEGEETEAAPQEQAPAPAGSESAVTETTDTAPQQAQPMMPQVDQQAINELQQRRASDQERGWREKVTRTAQGYERQLQENGYMPEQAREQARRYVAQEQKFRKQEDEAAGMVGYVQGKQAAAIHFMQQQGLANKQMIEDFMALQMANTPAEMEREARRMKRERGLVAENARLKQGRVPPQTFDNSQGAAEATSNHDRLLEAYNNGDRSEAAVKAARRMAFGA
jgi:hypothetical protein